MGQYGGIIGGVVGAVVGFFAGGNVYAGWMIGSAIGGAYSASQQVIPGPKIGDIATQTSQEGVPRPIVFGRSHPIAGNVICDGGPKVVTRRESQGKGGPKVETESAYRTYAVGFCEGPISAFLKVWKNNQLVYDLGNSAMAAENGEFLRYARFYLGSYSQMPSPDLEAVKGAGNVPAHRGTAYIVFKDEDVTDQRGMWSQWKVVVSTTADVGAPEDLSVLDNIIPPPPSGAIGPVLYINQDGVPEAITGYEAAWDWNEGQNAIVKTYLDPPVFSTYKNVSGSGADPLHILANDQEYVVAQGQSVGNLHLIKDGVTQALLIPSPGANLSWHYGEQFYYPKFGGRAFFYEGRFYLGVGITGATPVLYNAIYSWVAIVGDGSARLPVASIGGISTDEVGSLFLMHVSREGKVRTLNNDLLFKRYSSLLDFEGEDIVPDEILSVPFEELFAFGIDEGLDLAAYTYGDAEGYFLSVFRYSTNELIFTYELPAPDSEVFVKFIFTQDNLYLQFRGKFYKLSISFSDGGLLLSDVVSEICDRSGLDRYDTTSLTDTIKGYTVTNQYPASGALQSLSQVFFFDPSNQNGEIRFVKRGGIASTVINEQEMIDSGDEFRIEDTRRDTLAIPRVLHLNYYDIEGGLNTDKQFSERPEGTRSVGEQSLQTSVILNADEAATIVAINHGAMVEVQKGEVNFSLPDNFIGLTESDPIVIQYDGKSIRGVIAQVEIDDGEQKYKVFRDRQSLYTTRVQGIPAAPVPNPPSSIVGPTAIEVLDIPILRDFEDQLGFYLAISGTTPAWQGAFVEVSRDGGENYEEGQRVTATTTIGYTTTVLGDHPQAYPDVTNSVNVRMSTPNSLLTPTNLAGMMNRRNLAAIGQAEIINFSEVDEIEPGLWEISGFLRGRKGTQTQEHPITSRFVMLDGVIFVPGDLTALNRTLTFRATSIGRPIDEATVTTMVFTGQSQRERQPAYLSAYRSGGNIISNWQGVGRLGGGVNVAMGAYFATYRVTATDGATTTTQDVSVMNASIDASGFSGPVTISVQQVNSMTGAGPAIEVVVP